MLQADHQRHPDREDPRDQQCRSQILVFRIQDLRSHDVGRACLRRSPRCQNQDGASLSPTLVFLVKSNRQFPANRHPGYPKGNQCREAPELFPKERKPPTWLPKIWW